MTMERVGIEAVVEGVSQYIADANRINAATAAIGNSAVAAAAQFEAFASVQQRAQATFRALNSTPVQLGINAATGVSAEFKNAEASAAAFTAGLATQQEAAREQLSRTSSEVRNVGRVFGGLATEVALLGAAVSVPGLLATHFALSFESAFAEVRKSVEGTAGEIDTLRSSILQLSTQIPESAGNLARIAAGAGELGIARENVIEFTKVTAELGRTTNLTAEQAGTGLAQLANILHLPATQLQNVASELVSLADKTAASGSQILDFAVRLGAAGHVVGLTTAQILGFGSALGALGLDAESGGTAFSRVFANIAAAIRDGGARLDEFARVAGTSSGQFAALFKSNAADAVVAFVDGLGRIQAAGGDTFQTLNDLGLDQLRLRDALLRTAGAAGLLKQSLAEGNAAFTQGTALTTAFATVNNSAGAQLELFRNSLQKLAIDMGTALLPAISTLANALERIVALFDSLPAPVQTGLAALSLFAGGALTIGAGAVFAGSKIASLVLDMRELGAIFAATAVEEDLAAASTGGFALALGGASAAILPWAAGLAAAGLAVGAIVLALNHARGPISDTDKLINQIADDTAKAQSVFDQFGRLRTPAASPALPTANEAAAKAQLEDIVKLRAETEALTASTAKLRAEQAAPTFQNARGQLVQITPGDQARVEGIVQQLDRLAAAGAQPVRISVLTPGQREADALVRTVLDLRDTTQQATPAALAFVQGLTAGQRALLLQTAAIQGNVEARRQLGAAGRAVDLNIGEAQIGEVQRLTEQLQRLQGASGTSIEAPRIAGNFASAAQQQARGLLDIRDATTEATRPAQAFIDGLTNAQRVLLLQTNAIRGNADARAALAAQGHAVDLNINPRQAEEIAGISARLRELQGLAAVPINAPVQSITTGRSSDDADRFARAVLGIRSATQDVAPGVRSLISTLSDEQRTLLLSQAALEGNTEARRQLAATGRVDIALNPADIARVATLRGELEQLQAAAAVPVQAQLPNGVLVPAQAQARALLDIRDASVQVDAASLATVSRLTAEQRLWVLQTNAIRGNAEARDLVAASGNRLQININANQARELAAITTQLDALRAAVEAPLHTQGLEAVGQQARDTGRALLDLGNVSLAEPAARFVASLTDERQTLLLQQAALDGNRRAREQLVATGRDVGLNVDPHTAIELEAQRRELQALQQAASGRITPPEAQLNIADDASRTVRALLGIRDANELVAPTARDFVAAMSEEQRTALLETAALHGNAQARLELARNGRDINLEVNPGAARQLDQITGELLNLQRVAREPIAAAAAPVLVGAAAAPAVATPPAEAVHAAEETARALLGIRDAQEAVAPATVRLVALQSDETQALLLQRAAIDGNAAARALLAQRGRDVAINIDPQSVVQLERLRGEIDTLQQTAERPVALAAVGPGTRQDATETARAILGIGDAAQTVPPAILQLINSQDAETRTLLLQRSALEGNAAARALLAATGRNVNLVLDPRDTDKLAALQRQIEALREVAAAPIAVAPVTTTAPPAAAGPINVPGVPPNVVQDATDTARALLGIRDAAQAVSPAVITLIATQDAETRTLLLQRAAIEGNTQARTLLTAAGREIALQVDPNDVARLAAVQAQLEALQATAALPLAVTPVAPGAAQDATDTARALLGVVDANQQVVPSVQQTVAAFSAEQRTLLLQQAAIEGNAQARELLARTGRLNIEVDPQAVDRLNNTTAALQRLQAQAGEPVRAPEIPAAAGQVASEVARAILGIRDAHVAVEPALQAFVAHLSDQDRALVLSREALQGNVQAREELQRLGAVEVPIDPASVDRIDTLTTKLHELAGLVGQVSGAPTAPLGVPALGQTGTTADIAPAVLRETRALLGLSDANAQVSASAVQATQSLSEQDKVLTLMARAAQGSPLAQIELHTRGFDQIDANIAKVNLLRLQLQGLQSAAQPGGARLFAPTTGAQAAAQEVARSVLQIDDANRHVAESVTRVIGGVSAENRTIAEQTGLLGKNAFQLDAIIRGDTGATTTRRFLAEQFKLSPEQIDQFIELRRAIVAAQDAANQGVPQGFNKSQQDQAKAILGIKDANVVLADAVVAAALATDDATRRDLLEAAAREEAHQATNRLIEANINLGSAEQRRALIAATAAAQGFVTQAQIDAINRLGGAEVAAALNAAEEAQQFEASRGSLDAFTSTANLSLAAQQQLAQASAAVTVAQQRVADLFASGQGNTQQYRDAVAALADAEEHVRDVSARLHGQLGTLSGDMTDVAGAAAQAARSVADLGTGLTNAGDAFAEFTRKRAESANASRVGQLEGLFGPQGQTAPDLGAGGAGLGEAGAFNTPASQEAAQQAAIARLRQSTPAPAGGGGGGGGISAAEQAQRDLDAAIASLQSKFNADLTKAFRTGGEPAVQALAVQQAFIRKQISDTAQVLMDLLGIGLPEAFRLASDEILSEQDALKKGADKAKGSGDTIGGLLSFLVARRIGQGLDPGAGLISVPPNVASSVGGGQAGGVRIDNLNVTVAAGATQTTGDIVQGVAVGVRGGFADQ